MKTRNTPKSANPARSLETTPAQVAWVREFHARRILRLKQARKLCTGNGPTCQVVMLPKGRMTIDSGGFPVYV